MLLCGGGTATERFLPYVLEMAVLEAEEDGKSLAVVLVVVKKASGDLVAGSCSGKISQEIVVGRPDLIGPSTAIRVPGGRLDQMNGLPPTAVPDCMVDLVSVDMHPNILEHLILVLEYDGPTDLPFFETNWCQ